MNRSQPYRINCVLCLLIIGLLVISCSNKIYCTKGDPSSVRIIPKTNPFISLSDSVKRYLNRTTEQLKSHVEKIKKQDDPEFKEDLLKLSDTVFLKITAITGYFEAYRSQPCNPQAYQDYITSLSKLNQQFNQTKSLYEDIRKLTSGGGITGVASGAILDRITIYLSTRNE